MPYASSETQAAAKGVGVRGSDRKYPRHPRDSPLQNSRRRISPFRSPSFDEGNIMVFRRDAVHLKHTERANQMVRGSIIEVSALSKTLCAAISLHFFSIALPKKIDTTSQSYTSSITTSPSSLAATLRPPSSSSNGRLLALLHLSVMSFSRLLIRMKEANSCASGPPP